ncbi:hypothetical protein P3615_24210, partial [Salmonella enterica subsp. enterica serovar Isangi]|uniref:hypothetical protein n=1 Tax=Salmonella enterica TaxID=28901 RepID=UPI0023EBE830
PPPPPPAPLFFNLHDDSLPAPEMSRGLGDLYKRQVDITGNENISADYGQAAVVAVDYPFS